MVGNKHFWGISFLGTMVYLNTSLFDQKNIKLKLSI